MEEKNLYIWDYAAKKYMKDDKPFDEWVKGQNRISNDKATEYARLMKEWTDADLKDGKYAKDKNVFVLDGIIDPETWERQPTKILFVLKEAYDKTDKKENGLYVWDEPEWLAEQIRTKSVRMGKTWRRVYQWTHAILKWNAEMSTPRWDEDTFGKIAVINVKKTNGESSSVDGELLTHAKRHSDRLIRQIRLINPDVIVYGYTCWLVDAALSMSKNETIRGRKNDLLWYKTESFTDKEITVIDFWHPACREKDEKLYGDLLKSYRASVNGEVESSDFEENVVKE